MLTLFQRSGEFLRFWDWGLGFARYRAPHDLFLLEDLAVVIAKNAIIPPILISTFKITPITKHQIHNEKCITSKLISAASVFAFVEILTT